MAGLESIRFKMTNFWTSKLNFTPYNYFITIKRIMKNFSKTNYINPICDNTAILFFTNLNLLHYSMF